ncbi:MAG: lytic transglycosylase domain-containing protein [Acidobacteria bacterium]|nr:lytic transglycosylase domain-containing protein [Acidobacteriota bacterium]
MKLQLKENWWFVALTVALLAGFVYLIDQADQLRDQIAVLSEQNLILTEKTEHLSYVNDLAIEFSMDPAIVILIDRFSREYMKNGGPEWRLVRTPEFMSYIMLSLIYVESKGNTHAVGDGGKARGLTQIWVSTAKEYGDVTAEQLHRPETNLSFAFKHFQHLLQKYRGNLALALYAWNRGPGKVDRLLVYGESPQNGYAKKVYEAALMNNRELLTGSSR